MFLQAAVGLSTGEGYPVVSGPKFVPGPRTFPEVGTPYLSLVLPKVLSWVLSGGGVSARGEGTTILSQGYPLYRQVMLYHGSYGSCSHIGGLSCYHSIVP